MLSSLLAFLQSLPELIRLFKLFEDRLEQGKTERKVKDDLAQLHQAFEERDEKKLNALFNGPI